MSEEFIKISVDPSLTSQKVSQIEVPNLCSHCKRLTEFKYLSITLNKISKTVEATFQCKYQNCRGFLIAYYGIESKLGKLAYIEPPIFEDIELPDFATDVSPNFVLIFEQAKEAKSRGLHQIAGPGFRKACEFLIKDYAKSLIKETEPSEITKKEEEIENLNVGKVVERFITDERVQKVSKRAFWLGNDETHYSRKWTDKDIEDFIVLIRLTLAWIEIERLSAKYESEMP